MMKSKLGYALLALVITFGLWLYVITTVSPESEETGTISVALGGMLKRHLAPQTLERLLHNELCPDEPQEKDLSRRLKQKLTKKESDHDEK